MSRSTQFSQKMRFVSMNENATVLVNEASGDNNYDNVLAGSSSGKDKEEIAFQEGWNACEKQCQEEMNQLNHQYQEQLQHLHQQLSAVSEQLPTALNEYFQELESQTRQEVCDLALRIGEILTGQVMEKHDITEEIIQQTIAPFVSVKGVVIHLNPDFVRAIESGEKPAVLPAGVKMVADPSIKQGEAMVESSQGVIDATVRGRLAVLKEELAKALAEEKVDHV